MGPSLPLPPNRPCVAPRSCARRRTARALIFADSGQLHQVLLNLCLNVRDVMPEVASAAPSFQNSREMTERTRPRDGWTVRTAERGDLAAITDLHLAIQALHHEAEPAYYRAPDRAAIEAMVRERMEQTPTPYLVAAPTSGPAFGYIHLVPRGDTGSPLTEPWSFVELNEIYVRPEHRKRGVARALCTELAHRARENGARAIRLTVRHFNTDAFAAYEALGYRPLQHRLELRLDPPG